MAGRMGKTILLVDDEAIIAASEARMLEKNGYDVLTAYTGEQAIKTASENPSPDLILMDIDLGKGMDGTQAADIILNNMDIPVLFLSSHTEAEMVAKTEKITSYGYVVKNSGETVLLASIRMAFRLHDAHRKLRKREEDLRKSERKLSFIFDNTPNAITITEMSTGIVVEANRGVEWTGWTRDEIIGKSPQMLHTWVHPDEGERIRAIIKAEGKLSNHRIDFYKKDGSIAHALMNSVFLQMDGKQYLLTISNDITRLSESELELQRAKVDLEAINEELNATIEELEATNEELKASNGELEESKQDLEKLLDEHGKTLSILREKEYFLRRSQEIGKIGSFIIEFLTLDPVTARWSSSPVLDEIIGIDETYPRTRESWVALLVEPETVLGYIRDQVFRKKEIFDLIYQIRRFNDGETRWIHGLGEPQFGEGGSILRMIGTAQDITDRRAAEQSLRESEEQYRTLVNNMQDTVYRCDTQGNITFVSPSGVRLLGHESADELLGKNIARDYYFNPDERALLLEHLNKYGTVTNYEVTLKRKDGTPVSVSTNSQLFFDKEGNLLGIEGIFTDITRRKEAERTLRENEERFKDLVQHLPETVFETDTKGRITFVNEPSLERFGYTRKDLEKGISFLDIIDPRDHGRAAENLKKISRGEHLGLNEYTVRKKNGTTLTVLIHSNIIMHDGQRAGLRGFMADITESKRTEEALRQSDSRYRSILESLPIGMHMYRLEEEGRLVFIGANPAADNILGVDNSIFIGKTIEEAFPALVATDAPGRYREAAARGTPWHTEQIDYDENSIRGAFEVHAFQIGDRLMAAAFSDITARKQAEEKLRESEERWQFALDGAGDGVWDWNAVTDRVYFSHQWKAMLGYDDGEIGDTLQEWDSRLYPDDRERVYAELNRHFSGETPIYVAEHRVRCKNGEYKWIMDRGKVISRTPEGKPLRVIGTHTDISELKRNEEALGKAISEKEALLRELQHRMKNSLAMISGIINLELDRVKDENQRNVLDNIKGRIGSLSTLYSLLFQSDSVRQVDLGIYIQSIAGLLSDSYGAGRNIRIRQSYDTLRVATKNAAAWGLIVNELLTNSFKYAFPGGRTGIITINLTTTGTEIILTFSDNGTGLPAGFDIEKSHGLGLLLVKTLTLQLKGTLNFKRDEESTFTVRAPFSDEA